MACWRRTGGCGRSWNDCGRWRCAVAEREQEIRARVERLRSAGPIDVAADPGMNALRMIAHSDAEDLAYLLEENQQLRQDNKKNLAAWTNDLDGLRADLAAARAEVERLREALEKHGGQSADDPAEEPAS